MTYTIRRKVGNLWCSDDVAYYDLNDCVGRALHAAAQYDLEYAVFVGGYLYWTSKDPLLFNTKVLDLGTDAK